VTPCRVDVPLPEVGRLEDVHVAVRYEMAVRGHGSPHRVGRSTDPGFPYKTRCRASSGVASAG
jgi:hypothetical protein